MKSLISKKRLTEEEERKRTKQSLDSPQTIEANNKFENTNSNLIESPYLSYSAWY